MHLIRLLVILTGLCVFSGCAHRPLPKETTTMQKVYEFPGLKKDDLFEKTKMWVAQTFVSAKSVIEYENKEAGIIIGNGNQDFDSSVYRDNNINYNIKIEVKDAKIRVSYDNFTVRKYTKNILSGQRFLQYEGSVNDKNDLEDIKDQLSEISNLLSQYILGSSKSDNW